MTTSLKILKPTLKLDRVENGVVYYKVAAQCIIEKISINLNISLTKTPATPPPLKIRWRVEK
jgi:hypothetical protein